MAHKTTFLTSFICFLLLFLIISSSTTTTTTARILKSKSDHYPSAQDFVFQDVRDLDQIINNNGGDSFDHHHQFFVEAGRMVLENNDYPGTGANNHHDPKSPAKP